MTDPTPQDLLMGGGAQSWSWAIKQDNGSYLDKPPGTSITGTIDGTMSTIQQTDIRSGALQTWPDGKPKMQIIIPLQTQLRDDNDDDGKRSLFVKQSSNLQAAIRDAVKTAGAKNLEQGGTLTVTFTGTRPASQAGMNPVKIFTAQYQPPAQNTLMAETPQANSAQIAQQVAPAQQAPQAAPQPAQQSPSVQQQVAQQPATPPGAPDPKVLAGQLIAMGQPAETVAQVTGLPLQTVQEMVAPF